LTTIASSGDLFRQLFAADASVATTINNYFLSTASTVIAYIYSFL
jgi:hypothetical protein